MASVEGTLMSLKETDPVFVLLMQKLTAIESKLDTMRDQAHANDRRLDEIDRAVQSLREEDEKTNAQVANITASMRKTLDELAPVVETMRPLKKIVFAGVAVAILFAIAPQFFQRVLSDNSPTQSTIGPPVGRKP